jgi:hypothetical protein
VLDHRGAEGHELAEQVRPQVPGGLVVRHPAERRESVADQGQPVGPVRVEGRLGIAGPGRDPGVGHRVPAALHELGDRRVEDVAPGADDAGVEGLGGGGQVGFRHGCIVDGSPTSRLLLNR